MDLFIDKLAQKLTSNDNPRNEHTSEAKEIKKLKEKVENYEKLLQEMKLVNLKNIESAQRLRDAVEEVAEAFDATRSGIADLSGGEEEAAKEAELAAAQADRDMIKELFDRQSDTIHRENIKVYRNVQAAMGDSLSEQTKSILDAQAAAAGKSATGFIKVMSVLIFIAVLADIALKVLPMLGINF